MAAAPDATYSMRLALILALISQAGVSLVAGQDSDKEISLHEFSEFENSGEKFVAEELYENLSDKSSSLLRILNGVRQSLRQLLEEAGEKLARGQVDEITKSANDARKLGRLVDLIRVFLYDGGEGLGDCQDKRKAMQLTAFLGLFAFNRQGKLFKALHDRLIEQLAACKPQWDRQFKELVQTRLDDSTRAVAADLFDNIVSYSPLFRKRRIDDSRAHDEPFQFMTLEMFEQLVHQTPPPTPILLFLHRHFERELQLDENMQNRRLEPKVYKECVRKLIVPVCERVCAELRPSAEFYTNYLYENKLLDPKDVYVKLFSEHNDNEVHEWLVNESLCCQLSDPRASVHEQVFRQIRTGKVEARQELESPGDETTQLDDDKLVNSFLEMDQQFAKNRHELFMRENGFGRML